MPGWMVIGIVVVFALFFAYTGMRAWRYARKRRARVARVHLAAAEAREDDADFDPETVQRAAAALFVEIQARWTARDTEGLAELVGEDLMVEWRRRLDDFARKGWHNV